ncbi:MAG: hypothetical protein MUE85_15370 [Microscillaceae bacterium]|jgi:hypothetical protein|nr:hypothetical protein [Microscillaceae bacterium]
MKKIFLSIILLMLCLSSAYAQNKPPKYLCQKWRVDTLAMRQTLLKMLAEETADDKSKAEMMLIFLNGMVQELGKVSMQFYQDGRAILHSPQEIKRGVWKYDPNTKLLTIQNAEEESPVRFFVQELKAKRMILREEKVESESKSSLKSLTLIAEK